MTAYQITLDELWLLLNSLLTIAIKQGLDYGFSYNIKFCEKNSSYMYSSNLKRLNLLENWFYDLGFLEKQIGNGTRIPFVHYKQLQYVWTDKLWPCRYLEVLANVNFHNTVIQKDRRSCWVPFEVIDWAFWHRVCYNYIYERVITRPSLKRSPRRNPEASNMKPRVVVLIIFLAFKLEAIGNNEGSKRLAPKMGWAKVVRVIKANTYHL